MSCVPLLSCILMFALMSGCSDSRDHASGVPEARSDQRAQGPKLPESRSPGTVAVNAEMQRALHLKIEPLRAASAPREIPGFGRVLDPMPLATDVNELSTARAAAARSEEHTSELQSPS